MTFKFNITYDLIRCHLTFSFIIIAEQMYTISTYTPRETDISTSHVETTTLYGYNVCVSFKWISSHMHNLKKKETCIDSGRWNCSVGWLNKKKNTVKIVKRIFDQWSAIHWWHLHDIMTLEFCSFKFFCNFLWNQWRMPVYLDFNRWIDVLDSLNWRKKPGTAAKSIALNLNKHILKKESF